MSITDNRSDDLKRGPKSDRRNSVPQSDAQRFAAVENFCIFILRGMQRTIKNERAALVLSSSLVVTIHMLCEQEIKRIKAEQLSRKDGA